MKGAKPLSNLKGGAPIDGKQISSSDITANKIPWGMIDTFDMQERTPTIINTDIANGPGVHWIVIVRLHQTGYIYDPLGPKNHRVTSNGRRSDPEIFKRMREYFNITKIHFYPYKSQIQTNSLCGWHSIFIAKELERYLQKNPSATTSDLDRVIMGSFGRTAGPEDVAVLRKAFK